MGPFLIEVLAQIGALLVGILIVADQAEVPGRAHIVGIVDKAGDPVAALLVQGHLKATDIGIVVIARLVIVDRTLEVVVIDPSGLVAHILVIGGDVEQHAAEEALGIAQLVRDRLFHLHVGIAKIGDQAVALLLEAEAVGGVGLGAEMAVIEIEFAVVGDGMGDAKAGAPVGPGCGRHFFNRAGDLLPIAGAEVDVIGLDIHIAGVGIGAVHAHADVGDKALIFDLVLQESPDAEGKDIVGHRPVPEIIGGADRSGIHVKVIVDHLGAGFDLVTGGHLAGQVGVEAGGRVDAIIPPQIHPAAHAVAVDAVGAVAPIAVGHLVYVIALNDLVGLGGVAQSHLIGVVAVVLVFKAHFIEGPGREHVGQLETVHLAVNGARAVIARHIEDGAAVGAVEQIGNLRLVAQHPAGRRRGPVVGGDRVDFAVEARIHHLHVFRQVGGHLQLGVIFVVAVPRKRENEHLLFAEMGEKKAGAAEFRKQGYRAAEAEIDDVVRFLDVALAAVLPFVKPLGPLRGQVIGGIIVLQGLVGHGLPAVKIGILAAGVVVPGAVVGAGVADRRIHINAVEEGHRIVEGGAEVFRRSRTVVEGGGKVVALSVALLGDDIDEAGADVAIFGVEPAGLDLDLLNRALGEGRIGDMGALVIQGEAVQHHHRLVGAAAADEDALAPLLNARLEHEDLANSLHRHGLDRLGLDVHLAAGDITFDDRALGDNDHALAFNGLALDGLIGFGRAVDLHLHLAYTMGGISDHRNAQVIGARRQVDDRVAPLEIGDGAVRGALDDDVHAWQGITGLSVGHHAGQLAGRPGEKPERKHRQQEQGPFQHSQHKDFSC